MHTIYAYADIAAKKTYNLLKKPANGGMPASENKVMLKLTASTGLD
jgi:hypothetical protein